MQSASPKPPPGMRKTRPDDSGFHPTPSKKRRLKKPFEPIVIPELPPLIDEFRDPDIALRYTRDQRFMYVLGREELERLGLPALYDAPGWKRGDAIFSQEAMEDLVFHFREQSGLETDPIPAILLPYTMFAEDGDARPMTWDDAAGLLASYMTTRESLTLEPVLLRASEEMEELVPYELAALALLVAKRLGSRIRIRESAPLLVRSRADVIGLSFDGTTVKPHVAKSQP